MNFNRKTLPFRIEMSSVVRCCLLCCSALTEPCRVISLIAQNFILFYIYIYVHYLINIKTFIMPYSLWFTFSHLHSQTAADKCRCECECVSFNNKMMFNLWFVVRHNTAIPEKGIIINNERNERK